MLTTITPINDRTGTSSQNVRLLYLPGIGSTPAAAMDNTMAKTKTRIYATGNWFCLLDLLMISSLSAGLLRPCTVYRIPVHGWQDSTAALPVVCCDSSMILSFWNTVFW